MKKTRIIKLIAAIAVMAASLPEAQAISRVTGQGVDWLKPGTWHVDRDTPAIWTGGNNGAWIPETTHNTVGFFEHYLKPGDSVKIINTTVSPNGIRVETDYTITFVASTSAAWLTQYAEGKLAFYVTEGKTLTLKRGTASVDGKGTGMEVQTLGTGTEALRGNIVIGSGVTFRIGNASADYQGTYAGTVVGTSTITVKNGAVFALRRNVNLTGFEVKHDDYNVDVNGNKTTGGDYFAGAYDSTYVQFLNVEQGGTVRATNGIVLTQNGVNYTLQTDASGRAVNKNAKSGGNMTVFYKSGDTNTNLSAIVGKAGAALTSVELSAGTLTVDSLVSSVVNATGGTLAFVGGGVGAVNVNGDITVSGDTNPEGKVYNIAAQKVVTFAEDLQMEGLSIVGEGGAKVTVQNVSGATVQYALNEQNALLSASEITMTAQAAGAVTVGNKVAAATVDNESGYTLTLGNGNTAVQHVLASQGNIIFHNMGAEAITLADMTIGQGKQVGVYQGADTASEGTVSISDTLTAAGGTLLANLILDGATLDVNGGGENALTLGSQFGIAEGTLVTLDDATVTALEGLQIGGTLDLIKALSPQDQLTYLSSDYDGMWFDALFERTDNVHGDYKVYATSESFGLTKVSNVPEPTTGTLSLLALAALAARRRRH